MLVWNNVAVELKIIESKNYLETKTTRAAVLAILIFSTALLGKNGNGLLKICGLERFEIQAMILMVTSAAVSLGLYIYSRFVKSKGVLEITGDHIRIKRRNVVDEFKLEDVSHVKITHRSYIGSEFEKHPERNFKGDNWLEFETANKTLKVEFELDSRYKSNSLVKTVDFMRLKVEDTIYIQS